MAGVIDHEQGAQRRLFGDEKPPKIGAVGATVALDEGHYEIHLPNFDGPFDLLLHLIRKEELDVFDISLSRLTKAYLETLKLMQRSGIEPASDFLLMAATLAQIKSRMLLPRTAVDADALGEDIDPRTALMRQLLAYEAFREVTEVLSGQVRLGRDVFVRPGAQDRPFDEEPELPTHDIYRLARAFRVLIKKQSYQAPHEIYVERITIGERIAQIADRLASIGRLSFASLVDTSTSREEVITTFLALLEMVRLKLIGVEQRGLETPLYIQVKVEDINRRGEVAAGMLAE